MPVEEKSRRIAKKLYIIELKLLKVLPFLIALIYFSNTLLSVLDIDIALLSFIGGISFIPLVFMYVSSYVFEFCEYHRLPLHYIVVHNVLKIIGYYCNLELYLWQWIIFDCLLFGVYLFVILYLYLKIKHEKESRRII